MTLASTHAPRGAAAGRVTPAELHRLTSLHAPPGYVKSASEAALLGDEALPGHAFADPAGRRYPVATAAATWLSAAAFYEKAAADPEVEARIVRAAGYFGIARDVRDVRDKAAADRRDDLAALPDDHFAYVARRPGAPPERRLPVRNGTEAKVAAAWFAHHRDAFAYDDRRAIAQRILGRADALGAPLADADAAALHKAAGHGLCAAGDAVALVRGRAAECRAARGGGDLAAALDKVAAELEAAGPATRDPAVLAKVARLVDAADRATGLCARYGRDLGRPEDALFAVTEKVAAAYRDATVATATGALYLRDDLERLRPPALAAELGSAFAAAAGDGLWADAGKVAALLADPEAARRFDAAAPALGVVPVRAGRPGGGPGLAAIDAALAG